MRDVRRFIQNYRTQIVIAVIVILVVWGSTSMAYKVEADSQAVILRLGRFVKTTNPGLHFKWPWPIEEAHVVPIQRVQSLEFGYRTLVAARQSQFAQPNTEENTTARMLTGDLNLARVEWVVQYRIDEPQKYLFKIGGDPGADASANARDLIRDVSESVVRRIVGDGSVDTVITTGREEIADLARSEMQELLNEFQSGITLVNVKLQSSEPPDEVKDAFDEVNRAKQTKEKVVNEAKSKRNKIIPAAEGKRDQAIDQARGYALRIQKEAEGRANAFLSKLIEYEKAPKVTRTRLYIEAMEEILMNVADKIVIDESVEGMLPLLHLGQDQTGGRR
jgi:membrane protease subunit HflK